ncbi:MAG: glycosyltransferase [Psychroflexus sp.]|nr:glycosyltransferase [Psychroflexus sp.]MDN6310786.1 glycosyltransferase [Psychroflexus sp.]
MDDIKDIVVLIPHYNNPEGLLKSVISVGDFDNRILILVVDDGSETKKIDKQELINSSKTSVDFLMLNKNSGIENALNHGLHYIQNNLKHINFIARLDCDDICINNRFEKQYDFLKANRDINFVGSNVRFVDLNRDLLFNLILPTADSKIKRKMYFNAMFIHPAIFFRKEVLINSGLYPINRKAAEDYAFFFNVIKRNKVANIQENLVECIIDPDGISGKKRKQQVLSRIKVILDNFYFGYYPLVGLFRSFILLFIPRKMINYVKNRVSPD